MRESGILTKNGSNNRTCWICGHVSLDMLKLLKLMEQTRVSYVKKPIRVSVLWSEKERLGCWKIVQHVHH